MNKEREYWKWKNTIIDFNNISDEKADFGDYWTKKEMVFHYLGCPDDKIHEWYNGGWSCEYNHALSYAKELGLVENYIYYDDEIYEKQQEIDRLNNIINELEKYIKENSIYYNTSDGCQWVDQFKVLDKLKELKENK